MRRRLDVTALAPGSLRQYGSMAKRELVKTRRLVRAHFEALGPLMWRQHELELQVRQLGGEQARRGPS
jgi:hypothetical protein